MWRRFGLMAVFGLLIGGAISQVGSAPSIADILHSTPQRLHVSDLPASVRGVAIGSGDTSVLRLMGTYNVGLDAGESQSRSRMLLQLMNTTLVDPDEFQSLLEGKVPRIRGYALDWAAMSAARTGSQTPDPIFTETWIEAGKVLQWTPEPEVSRESLVAMFGPVAENSLTGRRDRTISNAKQVALALMMYSNDYDDVMAKADSTAKAQEIVQPYLRNNAFWKSENPKGGRLLYNTALSGVSLESLMSPANTPAIFDENPWPDGGRVVAFVDGHSKFAGAEGWASVWEQELQRRASARHARKPARHKGG